MLCQIHQPMLKTKEARSVLPFFLLFLLQAKTPLPVVSAQKIDFGFVNGVLGARGESIYNRSWYEEYFTEESVMILPQTGIYKGPDAIMEYVQFTSNQTSPYLANSLEVTASPPTILAFNTINGNIQARVIVTSELRSDPLYTSGDHRFRVATMFSVSLNSTTSKVDHVYVLYPTAFWDFFFEDLLDSDNTRHFISTTADKHCPINSSSAAAMTSLRANGSKQNSQHFESLKALPLTDGGYVDGNSQGCRALHAAFARNNSHHCPHISIVPTMDMNGDYKCQNSSQIQALDLFTQEDLDAFDAYILSAESFIENEDGWVMLPNDEMTVEEPLHSSSGGGTIRNVGTFAGAVYLAAVLLLRLIW